MWWSEGLTLALAATALLATAWRAGRYLPTGVNRNFARWVSCYTLLLIAAYSAIPYKTPWCLLSFHVGLVLLAGIGAVTLVQAARTIPLQAVVVALLLAACGQLAWQSYQTSFVHFADPENPFVHSPTGAKITELVDILEELTQVAPEGRDVEIHVIWHDNYYWPLPWYLRGLERVGYWNHVPNEVRAPIIISSPQLDEQLYPQLEQTHYAPYYYGVRHNVLVQLWVRDDLWEAHLRRIGRL
jgi:predicted membrane-bound mannosyltransferase